MNSPESAIVPASMKASVLVGPGVIRLEDRPVPTPGVGEVLVQVRAVGVCGSDVHYFEHGRIGDFVVRSPLVLGHEVSGQIAAVGGGVESARIGERVALEPGAPCRHCVQCRRGVYNLCPDIRFYGTPPIDGALCEYVLVPADFAYPVPDSVSDDAAALIEPLSVGIWANRKAGLGAGGSLLIAGAGPIGLVTLQVARAIGVTTVVLSDINADRLAVATGLGATGTRLAGGDDDDTEFDAFIDCSGVGSAIGAGIRSVRPGGRIVLVGMGADELTIPVARLQQRELVLTGTFRYANTWPDAIALVAGGAVDMDRLVTSHHALADVPTALRAGSTKGHVKAVISP
jgi:L-iditol 2-dehydrogenase